MTGYFSTALTSQCFDAKQVIQSWTFTKETERLEDNNKEKDAEKATTNSNRN